MDKQWSSTEQIGQDGKPRITWTACYFLHIFMKWAHSLQIYVSKEIGTDFS